MTNTEKFNVRFCNNRKQFIWLAIFSFLISGSLFIASYQIEDSSYEIQGLSFWGGLLFGCMALLMFICFIYPFLHNLKRKTRLHITLSVLPFIGSVCLYILTGLVFPETEQLIIVFFLGPAVVWLLIGMHNFIKH